MDKYETFYRDTLELSFSYILFLLKTIDYKDLREIDVVPMRRDGDIVGYETTIRWIDRSPAWR